MPFSDQQHRICTDLAEQSWSQTDHFLPADLLQELTKECRHRISQGVLHAAGIGRAAQLSVQKTVRGDHIQWLEAGQSTPTDRYLAALDAVSTAINQSLYLGLESLESHFAFYPPGAFYQAHLDRFRDDDSRTISMVLYLNDDWQPAHGGELRLHLDQQTIDIAPVANRLITFLSADILHEVLPTHHERLSLTGWFRRRAG